MPLLKLLMEAAALAEAHKSDNWEFAIEIGHLFIHGINVNEVRRLVAMGVAEAGVETTSFGATARQFRRIHSLTLPPKACLILKGTKPGEPLDFVSETVREPKLASNIATLRPRWDRQVRTLFIAVQVVKRYAVPAVCQVAVLNAFEEEGWPTYVDDPIPPSNGQDPKLRLHNTINALNRSHLTRSQLIRFKGNGDGQGVCWELGPVPQQ